MAASQDKPAPRRVRRRWRWGLSVVVFALALELVLQLGALVVHGGRPSTPAAALASDHVLCLGDSFTFGLGASARDRAYPAALRRALAADGVTLEVVNAGWPGQTCPDLLEQHLTRVGARTRAVCVLVGTNDSWKHPPAVTEAQLHQWRAAVGGSFRFEWRTGRLLQLMTRFALGQWSQAGPAPDVDGGASFGRALAFEQLLAQGFVVRPARRPALDDDDRATCDRARAMLGEGRAAAACELLDAALRSRPDRAPLLRLRVLSGVRAGRAVDAALARLADLGASGDDPSARELWIAALKDAGHKDEALRAARDWLAEHPDAVLAQEVKEYVTFELGQWAAHRQAAARMVGMLRPADTVAMSWVLQRYARSVAGEDPQRSARA